jgi:hypothetical protein
MDASQENPSTELQLMKTIVSDMMTKLTAATQLSADQLKMLLNMETQLHNLREQLEAHDKASRARSNGAAATKVVQVHQHHQRTETSPLPVLKAVAVLEELPQEDTKKRLGDVQTVQKDKPKEPVLKEVAVLEELPQEDTKKLQRKPKEDTRKRPRKRRKKATTSSTTEEPKPEKGFILFQTTVINNPAYETEALVLKGCEFSQRSKYVSSLWHALPHDDREAYKSGNVPALKAPALAKSAAAPAGAAASAKAVGKEAQEQVIETDSDDDDDDVESWDYFDLIEEFAKHFKIFDETELTSYSIWIIDQLAHPWGDSVYSKEKVFRRMCRNNVGIWNMKLFNKLLAETYKDHLSKPCFLANEMWDDEVVRTFNKWKKKVPSASLDLLNDDSALHTCIITDFDTVKAQMKKFLKDSESIDWPTFATELLVLCAMQPGNAFRDPSTDGDRSFWLPLVEDQFKHV